ncbi:MAG: hypothetical protein LBN99_04290 [Oscillospiraceae bacterium]|nr:hypothetical protein [Oscillospiraceae bacterium]
MDQATAKTLISYAPSIQTAKRCVEDLSNSKEDAHNLNFLKELYSNYEILYKDGDTTGSHEEAVKADYLCLLSVIVNAKWR